LRVQVLLAAYVVCDAGLEGIMFKEIIENAGARYIGTADGVVYFSDCESGHVLRLYCHALRSVDDVLLALKASREPVVEFAPLERTE
jgi:hypothetical protein